MGEMRYDTPQEAETAFYAAFIKRDVDAMMAVWAEDDNVACIHPLREIISGRAAVRASWEAMFHNAPGMQFMINERVRTHGAQLAVHIVEEHIRVKDAPPGMPVIATNVYRLTAVGWRMVLHHASPAPPGPKAEPPTLH
jgi:ketosteroid isomerase-like protein